MRAPDNPTATWFLVSPDSVLPWFHYFARLGRADRFRHIGEAGTASLQGVWNELTEAAEPARVVIYSSHDSLVRDRAFADLLAESGFDVLCQSRTAVDLALDKVRMKQFFDRCGLRTADWHSGGSSPQPHHGEDATVVKQRSGTQSLGIRLADGGRCAATPDEFCERYHDGVEYSVVVYRDSTGCTTFPPVWKGPTSPGLVPPWRRLRICPDPLLAPGLEAGLRQLSEQIACAADVQGYAEIEYLVIDDGAPLVLEINPRISGTMRIGAMATGVPVFTPGPAGGHPSCLTAARAAAEAPYHGEPFADPVAGVFGTSRITAVADDVVGVRAKLERYGADPRWLAEESWLRTAVAVLTP